MNGKSRLQYIARRGVASVVVILGMTIVTFAIVNVIPADPIRYAAGPNATAEIVENMRRQWGMDRPLPEQYVRYIGRIFTGDLGVSILSRQPVREDIATYFPATLELALAAFLVTAFVGVGMGMLSALYRDSWVDGFMQMGSVFGAAIPIFWLGIMLQMIFYFYLSWLPPGSRLSPGVAADLRDITGLVTLDALLQANAGAFLDGIKHLILPVFALSLGRIAIVARIARVSLLEVISLDFVRTARSKGLTNWVIMRRHVLKPAFVPIISTLATQMGYMLGGSFLIEVIFQWPGLGRYAVLAVGAVDFNAIMGATLVIAVSFLTVNLIADLLYLWADPRITL